MNHKILFLVENQTSKAIFRVKEASIASPIRKICQKNERHDCVQEQ